MKAGLFAIGLLVLMTSCKAGYGPLEDHSAFVSAQLAEDKRTIVFSAHQFAYRAATGWRAFPDGGIPDYVTDVNLLGVYDLQTRNVKIIRREKNSDKVPGYEDVTQGVILSSDRKALECGAKVDGQWKYERLDLKPNLLK
jgi:hypothetical protein